MSCLGRKVPAAVYKRVVVREAIKKVAPGCIANFEIPVNALSYIEKENRMRKKPVRASYDYVQKTMYDMLDNKEI